MATIQEEPIFNYSRFVKWSAVSSAAITCAVIHNKFLAIGSSSGTVHMFELNAGGKEWRRMQAHSSRINDICVDLVGEFLGTSAEDGTVVVSSVLNEERTVHSHHKAVKCVRLAPDFHRQRDRPLLTGGMNGRLYLLKKGWLFGSMSERLIHEGEGPIRSISWRGSLIAWANDAGVKVYDYERDERVCFVEAPTDAPKGDIAPPRLCWESDSSLLIGWGFEIRIMSIRERKVAVIPMAGAPPGAPNEEVRRVGELAVKIALSSAICGVCPLGDDIAALCLNIPGPDICGSVPRHPHVSLLALSRNASAPPLYEELIPLTGVSTQPVPSEFHLVCDHYSVLSHDKLPVLVVVSPKDVVFVQPRGVLDHIEWEIQHERFESALSISLAHPGLLSQLRRRNVVNAFIQQKLSQEQPQVAAAACAKLLHNDPGACEGWIARVCESYPFSSVAAFLVPVLATFENAPAKVAMPTLGASSYTKLLDLLLQQDPSLFLTTLRGFHSRTSHLGRSSACYDFSHIFSAVEYRYHRAKLAEEKEVLISCLVDMYLSDNKPLQAIDLLFAARTPAVDPSEDTAHIHSDTAVQRIFELIVSQDLIAAVRNYIPQLVSLDRRKSALIVCENLHVFSLEEIAAQLRTSPLDLLYLLHEIMSNRADVYNATSYSPLHDIQLHLYAAHDRAKLRWFLEHSSCYSLDTARTLCVEAPVPLFDELAFVLARMGSARDALDIALDKLHDVKRAVDIARAFDDEELWTELVRKAINSQSGSIIGELLDNILNTPLNPVRIISMIPEGTRIPKLQGKLVATLRDRTVHRDMVKICNELFKGDVVMLVHRFLDGCKAPICMQRRQNCALCRSALNARTREDDEGAEHGATGPPRVAIFFCRHAFHEKCLDTYTQQIQRKRTRSRSSSAAVDSRRRGSSLSLADRPSSHGFSRNAGTLLLRSSNRIPRSNSGLLQSFDDTDIEVNTKNDSSAQCTSARCPLCAGDAETVST